MLKASSCDVNVTCLTHSTTGRTAACRAERTFHLTPWAHRSTRLLSSSRSAACVFCVWRARPHKTMSRSAAHHITDGPRRPREFGTAGQSWWRMFFDEFLSTRLVLVCLFASACTRDERCLWLLRVWVGLESLIHLERRLCPLIAVTVYGNAVCDRLKSKATNHLIFLLK